jgi:hypothetical protein
LATPERRGSRRQSGGAEASSAEAHGGRTSTGERWSGSGERVRRGERRTRGMFRRLAAFARVLFIARVAAHAATFPRAGGKFFCARVFFPASARASRGRPRQIGGFFLPRAAFTAFVGDALSCVT